MHIFVKRVKRLLHRDHLMSCHAKKKPQLKARHMTVDLKLTNANIDQDQSFRENVVS